jgi:hypothetical protein
MRVGRAHHGAAVFEDLHVTDPVEAAELDVLVDPGVDHRADRLDRHLPQRQVVPRREAHDPADAALALRDQQTLPVVLLRDHVRRRAAKSLSNTWVEPYRGLRAPPARSLPGQR